MLLVPAIRLLIAGAVAAQPQDQAPSVSEPDQIIVQGLRDRDERIGQFIRDLTPAPSHGQLGRFEDAICPAVAGVPGKQVALIASRIRRVAQAAGMPVARPGCDPNVILIVTNDKANLVKLLEKRRDYFPMVRNSYDFRALEDPATPVAAWQIKATRGADGKELRQDMDGSAVGRTGLYVQKTIEASTRLRPATRPYFAASVVIVQADALDGLTTTQLADYAAMRAFIRTDPDQVQSSNDNTILNVIGAPMGTPVPPTLTAWDLAVLKAYYASELNKYAASQRSEMKSLMKRDFDRQATRKGE